MKVAESPARVAGALATAAVVTILLAGAPPAAARILKTRVPAEPGRELALTLGSGFEYQSDSEETETGFPFLLEYGLTPTLMLSVEPSYVVIRPQVGKSIQGSGDLETTLDLEVVSERRHRPALGLEGIVKWPTAAHERIGTHQRDYSLGVVVSKGLVQCDLDANAVYTFVGDPPGGALPNTFESSLSCEWHLRPSLDLLAEVVSVSGAGGSGGRPGSLGGFGRRPGLAGAVEAGARETEATFGLAEHLNDALKLEEGAIVRSDGSWQAVFAWEWDFAGAR